MRSKGPEWGRKLPAPAGWLADWQLWGEFLESGHPGAITDAALSERRLAFAQPFLACIFDRGPTSCEKAPAMLGWGLLLVKRGLSLVLVALVLIWISRSTIWAQSDGKFGELTELMDRQENLWFAPPPERLQETDVSASFCGQFTPEDLHQIAAEHPTITKFLADVKFQNLPPATDAWWFTRPTWKAGRGAQSLGIYLAPGGFCYANYRHIF